MIVNLLQCCILDRHLLREVLGADLGLEMVSEIVTLSEAGRAPRQSPGIFALALIITHAKHHSSTQSASEDTDEQKLARSAKASASRRVRSKLFSMQPHILLISCSNKPISSRLIPVNEHIENRQELKRLDWRPQRP